MALVKSSLLSEISGSIGGTTYFKARGGLSARNRSVPVQPGTDRQVAVQANTSAVAPNWSQVLTSAQRAAWNLYAQNVQLPGRLGDMRNVSGQAMYMRSAMIAAQANSAEFAGLDGIPAGPTVANLVAAPIVFDLGAAGASFSLTSVVGNNLTVAFDNTADWAGEVGAIALVYISKPHAPGREFFKGPWRLAGAIVGAMTPPTSPQVLTLSLDTYQPPAGTAARLKIRVFREDGRLSEALISNTVIAS